MLAGHGLHSQQNYNHPHAQALLLRINMPEPLELIARARLASEAGAASPVEAAEADAADGRSLSEREAAVAELLVKMRHRVPLAALLRHHLLALLLFVLVACYAQASVYTVTSWLAKHFRDLGVPNFTTQVRATAAPATVSGMLSAITSACTRATGYLAL